MRFLDLLELHLQDVGFYTRKCKFSLKGLRRPIGLPFELYFRKTVLQVNNARISVKDWYDYYPMFLVVGSDVYCIENSVDARVSSVEDWVPVTRIEDPDCFEKIVRKLGGGEFQVGL